MSKNKCLSCRHVNSGAESFDENLKPKGRKYYCDLKVIEQSTDGIINNEDCEKYDKHGNQRILGHYLLGFRDSK